MMMMYKMKLQELCQKRQWAMPKYSCMKCGPDHHPRFGASVFINDMSFDSLVACKSSNQAHNHVAMLAFLHFTSTSDISATITKSNIETQNAQGNHQSDDATVIDDVKFQYKRQLLKYTKQRNLEEPLYSCKSDNEARFKATVRVADRLFQCPQTFSTFQEAENGAAKFAFMSLLIDNFQSPTSKDFSGPYKSMLQELAQEEGLTMPVYKTTNSGLPHKPLFTSFVELEGEIFHGKVANSKKLAELEAAKVAYLTLFERGARRIRTPDLAYDSLQSLEKYEENNAVEPLSLSFPEIKSSVSSDLEDQDVSDSSSKLDISSSTSLETSSYLVCNKVRVYRKFPNREFPEGIIVLPISDDKWVAVQLEFPNEETN